ncbi:hypothetical protein JOD54_000811 [Actinokineospora baliensis]|uniref:endonuclease VII domain-containing protein n=1 Tax=Actinokineospora baliensis TaxID=547056 RepID=UPI00195DBC5F|nr:endonuclease VII domain-containing protein [Actinokineospora baliensis]MBM7770607.1 hypothetical protein [Actinokineospora baliensis]
MEVKTCTRCAEEKPLAEYYHRPDSRDGRRSACSSCCRAASTARHRANRDRTRDRRYLHRYGITADQVDRMRAEQRYRCAICNRHEDRLPLGLMVDHCHSADIVRGLLCNECNSGLGQFRESIDLFHTAIAYLQRSYELIALADSERNPWE